MVGMDIRDIVRQQQLWRENNPEAARWFDSCQEAIMEADYYRFLRFADWPTQAHAARLIGVNRASIGRAVARGELETNGFGSFLRRVNPMSLWEYMRKRAARERARDGRWATGRG